MSTEQTPTTDISDVNLIKRRDIVTFAVVALTQLTTIQLLEHPSFSNRELKLWDDEDVDGKSSWEIAYFQCKNGLWTIRWAPKRLARRLGMISHASEAKIADLENILEKKTFDLIENSIDISNHTLSKNSNRDSETTLDDDVLKPFIRDYAEYTQKGKLELGNINSGAIYQELFDLMPSNPLGQEFPSWQPLLELYMWAVDPEPGAGERFCERVNAARQSKISGTFA